MLGVSAAAGRGSGECRPGGDGGDGGGLRDGGHFNADATLKEAGMGEREKEEEEDGDTAPPAGI